MWQDCFRSDPVNPLLASKCEAVIYFVRKDLLDEDPGPLTILRDLKQPKRLLNTQQPAGHWRYPGKTEDGFLLATFKNLQALVYQYGFDRRHPQIEKACEYLFSYQTPEGDVRGFIGNQYAPYYTGLVAALLIEAGYGDNPRIEKAIGWLLSMRQSDGGWVIGSPGMLGMTHPSVKQLNYLTSDKNAPTMKAFDWSRPSSHAGTGMVIRAFAAHPGYSRSAEAARAAAFLKSRFFKEDNYTSYQSAEHWVRFQYPFWWNNLLAAMDSLSRMGWSARDPDVEKGLDWFLRHQQPDGLWNISYSRIHKTSENSKTEEQQLWINLAVCRVFKRFFARV
jgi:hypothetical protein